MSRSDVLGIVIHPSKQVLSAAILRRSRTSLDIRVHDQPIRPPPKVALHLSRSFAAYLNTLFTPPLQLL